MLIWQRMASNPQKVREGMNTYWYHAEGSEYLQGNFIDAETVGKARYKIWLKGACDLYDTFKDFIKHLRIRKVKREVTP